LIKTYVAAAGYSDMKAGGSASILQAISIGILAGMRSASAPAIACHILSKNKLSELTNSSIGFMESESLATVLKVFAVGEFIVDKLPFTPPRIRPAGVTARIISGGLSAAAVSKAKENVVIPGALLGSAAALVSTFAFYFIRKKVGERANVYDPILGGIEDALVIGAGLEMARTV
jgi:uncharacterized membrane protein